MFISCTFIVQAVLYSLLVSRRDSTILVILYVLNKSRCMNISLHNQILIVSHSSICASAIYPTMSMSDLDPYKLREKYTRFRILVIGRANAGKTTLLQRVCNTTEDPCIYDDDKNLVRAQYLKMNSASDISTSFNLPQRYPTYYRYLLMYLTLPMLPYSEGYMTSIGPLHSRATPDLSFTILQDLRQATKSNCRMSCRLWRRKQSRLK